MAKYLRGGKITYIQITDIQITSERAADKFSAVARATEKASAIARSTAVPVSQQGEATREISANVQEASTGARQVAGEIISGAC